MEWCSQNFAGGADFVQKLLPKNAKEKKLTASQFKEGIAACFCPDERWVLLDLLIFCD